MSLSLKSTSSTTSNTPTKASTSKKPKGTKIELKDLSFKFSPGQSISDPDKIRKSEIAKTFKSFQNLKKGIKIEDGVKTENLSRDVFGSRSGGTPKTDTPTGEIGELFGKRLAENESKDSPSGDRFSFGRKMLPSPKIDDMGSIFGSKQYEDPMSLNLECFKNFSEKYST